MLLGTLGASLLGICYQGKELQELVLGIKKEKELQELVMEKNEIFNAPSSFNKF